MSTQTFKRGDQVIWTPALKGKMPQLAQVNSNPLPDEKYEIISLDDNEKRVVKAERLTPANPAVPAATPAPQIVPPTTSFHVGQRVIYTSAKNGPVNATVRMIGDFDIGIVRDGTKKPIWVSPDLLTPITNEAVPAAKPDLPSPADDLVMLHQELSNEIDEFAAQIGPRPVDLDRSAITGVCTVCGEQYDYFFYHCEMDTPQWREFVYWSALVNPCPVCKLMLADHDTEELPALSPRVLSGGMPTIAAYSMESDIDTEQALYNEEDAILGDREPEIPLAFEVADGEHNVDPFDHPAVTTRIAQLNQRIADLVEMVGDRDALIESLHDKIDDYRLGHIELLKRIPIAPGSFLDAADLDRLDWLCWRHLDRGLSDALRLLGFQIDLDTFSKSYAPFQTAYKALYQRIIDGGIPVVIHEGLTDVSTNDKLYFSVSFGFGTVAFWNGDLAHAFERSRYAFILDHWRTPGYAVEFNPPLRAILTRDFKQYPKIKTLLEDES